MRLTISTATALVTALALAIATGACDSGSTNSITGIETPAPDAALMSQGPVVTFQTVELDAVTHNACTGEDVHVEGPVYYLFRRHSDQAGGFILGITRTHQDVNGTGLTTGDTYRIEGVHTFQAHVRPPFPRTWNEQFRIAVIGPAGEAARLHGHDQFTMDANGMIRVDELHFAEWLCPG
jgi:hypothetical protein